MTKTILLVEDNASDEKLALVAFKKCGVPHEVIVKRDGASALEYLHASDPLPEMPSLLLLDLKLPKLDGLEVLRRVRAHERTRSLPVVILTASGEQEDIASCYRMGANAYLRKPVEFDRFVESARTIGQFWLVMNEWARTS